MPFLIRWLDLEMRKQSMSSVLQKAIRHALSGFLLFSEVELTGQIFFRQNPKNIVNFLFLSLQKEYKSNEQELEQSKGKSRS